MTGQQGGYAANSLPWILGEQVCVLLVQKTSYILAVPKQCDQQVEGDDSALVDTSWNAACSSGVPKIKRAWICWSESRGDHGDNQKSGALLL